MNKYTNFLTALISGDSCTEKEVKDGFCAIKAAGIACEYSNTQADGSFKAGRNGGTDYWGKSYLKSSGYILTPSYQIAVDSDSKDAGEMSAFSIGRMDDREVFQTVARGRYHVELKDVFLALANVVIADNEIYSQEAIPVIVSRINAPKVDVIESVDVPKISIVEIYSQEAIPVIVSRINAPKVDVIESVDVPKISIVEIDAEELKAARKAAKQAAKAAAIAARKGR